MKLVKTASGHKIKMSQKEWTDYGKKAGWVKEALGEAGEAYIDEKGMPTTPDAGQEVADVHLSEEAIMDMLRNNFGYKVTSIPGGVVLTRG